MSILPLATKAQSDVDAGPNQTVYEGQQVSFDGSVSLDNASIISVKWDFGDGSTPERVRSSPAENHSHLSNGRSVQCDPHSEAQFNIQYN